MINYVPRSCYYLIYSTAVLTHIVPSSKDGKMYFAFKYFILRHHIRHFIKIGG